VLFTVAVLVNVEVVDPVATLIFVVVVVVVWLMMVAVDVVVLVDAVCGVTLLTVVYDVVAVVYNQLATRCETKNEHPLAYRRHSGPSSRSCKGDSGTSLINGDGTRGRSLKRERRRC